MMTEKALKHFEPSFYRKEIDLFARMKERNLHWKRPLNVIQHTQDILVLKQTLPRFVSSFTGKRPVREYTSTPLERALLKFKVGFLSK